MVIVRRPNTHGSRIGTFVKAPLQFKTVFVSELLDFLALSTNEAFTRTLSLNVDACRREATTCVDAFACLTDFTGIATDSQHERALSTWRNIADNWSSRTEMTVKDYWTCL